MHTHSLSEWAAFLSLAVGVHGTYSAPWFLSVEADLKDFDPRPAVRRAVDRARPVVWDVTHSEALYPLQREWINAPHAARQFLRDAACGVAALLILTIPTGDRS
jgi:hypothetical protein